MIQHDDQLIQTPLPPPHPLLELNRCYFLDNLCTFFYLCVRYSKVKIPTIYLRYIFAKFDENALAHTVVSSLVSGPFIYPVKATFHTALCLYPTRSIFSLSVCPQSVFSIATIRLPSGLCTQFALLYVYSLYKTEPDQVLIIETLP